MLAGQHGFLLSLRDRRGGRTTRGSRYRLRSGARRDASTLQTCIVCGADLKRGRRRYCASCRPVQTLDAVSKAHKVLRARRAAGDDPAHGGEAARRRGARIAAILRANSAWEREGSGAFDPDAFSRTIGPKLAGLSLSAIMRATGLSRPYCAMIRRGARIPHPRHWVDLRALLSS